MESQQHKSIEKILEEEINKRLEFNRNQINGLLHRIIEYVKEEAINKYGIKEFGVRGYLSEIYLSCHKSIYGDTQCDHNIKIEIYNSYNENDKIKCHSDSEHSPNKFECTHDSSKSSFELSDYQKNIPLIEGIKNSVLYRLYISNPKVLTDRDNQNVLITAYVPGNGNIKMNWLTY